MEGQTEIVLGEAELGKAVLGADIFWFGIAVIGAISLVLAGRYFIDRLSGRK
jgi:hypothetical protein